MDKKLMKRLEEEVLNMEVQIIISETSLSVINSMDVSGAQVEQVAQQKAMVQNTLQMQRLVVAALKNKIEVENKKEVN